MHGDPFRSRQAIRLTRRTQRDRPQGSVPHTYSHSSVNSVSSVVNSPSQQAETRRTAPRSKEKPRQKRQRIQCRSGDDACGYDTWNDLLQCDHHDCSPFCFSAGHRNTALYNSDTISIQQVGPAAMSQWPASLKPSSARPTRQIREILFLTRTEPMAFTWSGPSTTANPPSTPCGRTQALTQEASFRARRSLARWKMTRKVFIRGV